MKLRIKGNSIRLRLLRSEVTKLIETGRIEETIHFSSDSRAMLTYSLKTEAGQAGVRIRHEFPEVSIVLPVDQAKSWADTNQVGIYATVDIGGHGALEIIVEKDFACLDLSDAENHDTFANPEIGAAC